MPNVICFPSQPNLVMSEKLKITFDEPQHGWVGLTISYGDVSVTIVASYTPHDSFLELTNALRNLLLYEGEATVIWNEEPAESEIRFSRKNEEVKLDVWYDPDHRRDSERGNNILKVTGSYKEICHPFWRALRDLQGRFTAHELDTRWHRPFPSKEINMLTAAIKNANSITESRI